MRAGYHRARIDDRAAAIRSHPVHGARGSEMEETAVPCQEQKRMPDVDVTRFGEHHVPVDSSQSAPAAGSVPSLGGG